MDNGCVVICFILVIKFFFWFCRMVGFEKVIKVFVFVFGFLYDDFVWFFDGVDWSIGCFFGRGRVNNVKCYL